MTTDGFGRYPDRRGGDVGRLRMMPIHVDSREVTFAQAARHAIIATTDIPLDTSHEFGSSEFAQAQATQRVMWIDIPHPKHPETPAYLAAKENAAALRQQAQRHAGLSNDSLPHDHEETPTLTLAKAGISKGIHYITPLGPDAAKIPDIISGFSYELAMKNGKPVLDEATGKPKGTVTEFYANNPGAKGRAHAEAHRLGFNVPENVTTTVIPSDHKAFFGSPHFQKIAKNLRKEVLTAHNVAQQSTPLARSLLRPG